MDEKFGTLTSYTDVEQMILDHFALWMDTWLAARERKVGIAPGTIARPRSYIIKRTFNAFHVDRRADSDPICGVNLGTASQTRLNGADRMAGMMRRCASASLLSLRAALKDRRIH